MIKILCCEHAVQKLINEGRFFKFSLEFNCDCDFHKQMNVLKCLQNDFFVKTNVKLKEECTCKDQLTCGFPLSRLFMLNHMVYKVCIKNKDALIKDLPTISDFFIFFNW